MFGAAPQHKVRITRPFYLGVHEVTQEQYKRMMGKNLSLFEGAAVSGGIRDLGRSSDDSAVMLSSATGRESGRSRVPFPTEGGVGIRVPGRYYNTLFVR